MAGVVFFWLVSFLLEVFSSWPVLFFIFVTRIETKI